MSSVPGLSGLTNGQASVGGGGPDPTLPFGGPSFYKQRNLDIDGTNMHDANTLPLNYYDEALTKEIIMQSIMTPGAEFLTAEVAPFEYTDQLHKNVTIFK